jgi:twitching motility protein PilT
MAARLDGWLRALKEHGGSDLHLAAGSPPRIRAKGELHALANEAPLTDAEIRSALREAASEEQWQEYESCGDLDFAYGIAGLARFRANFLVQHSGASAVFRMVPEEIRTVEQLALPPAISQLSDLSKGLVLVTGPTGSGKSTTLAAIIDAINANHAKHIVTIEDPVEFVHQNKRSVLSHREVGAHTGSFAEAVRGAIRQDADVVLVGEMRDRETMQMAITAAEMGLLVFGTLHTNGAARSIDRIIDAFPTADQNQIRLSLSESLAAVVAQLLLPAATGKGRCAVYEILLRTQGLPNVIREGNSALLASIIQSGKSIGMQSMDDALFAAVKEGRVKAIDAHGKATDKGRFDPLLSAEDKSAA